MKLTPKQFDLSIVIPAYHEEKRIGKTLDELAAFLKSSSTFRNMSVEILVVSADSPDQTHDIVLSKKHLFKYLTLLKPGAKVGKGRDVQYGMLRAKGAAIIFMDADLATPLWHMEKFYRAFVDGADVVAATRNLHKHHESLSRRILSTTGNILFRLAGGVWIEDSQCGFKMFSRRAAEICFTKLSILGWGFDMEVLSIAKVNKLRIVSYRVDDWVSVPDGTFVAAVLQNALTSLSELGKITVKRISGAYRNY